MFECDTVLDADGNIDDQGMQCLRRQLAAARDEVRRLRGFVHDVADLPLPVGSQNRGLRHRLEELRGRAHALIDALRGGSGDE